MLKSIDPLLGADLLHTLAAMGHGDRLVVADANFPADAVARSTTLGRPLHLAGVDAPRAVKAILSVLPLDTFVTPTAFRMEVVGAPSEWPAVQREVQAEIDLAEGRPTPMGAIERFAFYEEAKKAYAVVACGERRFYGCFVFIKGVIGPDAE